MPSTVPGMANASSAPNSNARCPANLVRASSHAISRPSVAHSGAAIAASRTVVNSEFHAVPAQTRPCSPHCRSNAVRRWASVGV